MAACSCIGIDLGTTYSCVGAWEHNGVAVIANKFGHRTTPSWVAFDDSERLVGEAARNQAGRNARNTIYDAKRLIGRKFEDPVLQQDLKLWPFKVVKGKHDLAAFEVNIGGQPTVVTPEEISAAILRHMKEIAEDYLGKPVTHAVITVPAYFNDAQRQATRDAGIIAGLTVERIINEPTAAALAYGHHQPHTSPSTLLIFDFGGGTLDVTVMVVDGGVFEVRATCGDTHLGGEDIDTHVVTYFLEEFKRQHPQAYDALLANPRALNKLRQKTQEVKHILSTSLKSTIDVDSLIDGIDFQASITRIKFNELNREIFARCLIPVQKALQDAKLDKNAIDEIVLIGGSTRIPEVQAALEGFFPGKVLSKRINPDEAVAFGAAIQAANLTLPVTEKQGTALEQLTLLDVTPLSLGIELADGRMSVIIPRNTSIPYSHTRTYYNYEDNQTFAAIEVYEGESALVSDNRLLGCFTLTDLPLRPRGKLAIEVTFSLSTDGILDVAGEVRESPNITKKLSINKNKGLLSREEVDALAASAHKLADADSEKDKKIKAIHELQEFAVFTYAAHKCMNQLVEGGRGHAEVSSAVVDALRWAEANADADTTVIAARITALHDLWQAHLPSLA